MIITIACPAAHVDDANNLAMVLGYGPEDGKTYPEPQWRDVAGNLYSVASGVVSGDFISNATSTLERPEWDKEPYLISMVGAKRAQFIVLLWVDGSPASPPLATPDHLTAIAGPEGLVALDAMGLVMVEVSNDWTLQPET